MKVFLLNPPIIEEGQLEAETIPLGLVSIHNFLVKNIIDSELINLYTYKSWEDISKFFSTKKFDVIGIPCYSRQRFSVFKLAKLLKTINKNAFIVLGGPHVTYLSQEIITRYSYIDFIILGEGELTLLKLINTLERKDIHSLQSIENITYKSKGEVIITNMSSQLSNLMQLPIPVYTKDKISTFFDCKSLNFHFSLLSKNSYKMAPILFSRGCNYSCVFCCNGAFWKKQFYYSVNQIFQQIKYYYDYGIQVFDVFDDDLLSNKLIVMEVCDLIIKNNYKIHWWCSTRIDHIDNQILEKIKLAGCFMISFGIESGSDKILKVIKKGINLNNAKESIILVKKYQILVRLTISIGYEGENEDTILDTINFINEVKPDKIGLFIAKVYPGTPLHNIMLSKNKINTDYWFNDKNKTIPFFTIERDISWMIQQKERIINGILAEIYTNSTNSVYSEEIDLKWNLNE